MCSIGCHSDRVFSVSRWKRRGSSVWMTLFLRLPSPSEQSGPAGRGGGVDSGDSPRRRPPGPDQLLPVQRGKRAGHPVQRHGRAGEPPRRPRLPAHQQRQQEQHLQEHRQVGPNPKLRIRCEQRDIHWKFTETPAACRKPAADWSYNQRENRRWSFDASDLKHKSLLALKNCKLN